MTMKTAAQFQIRTLEEVAPTAQHLAQYFPDPHSAITGIFELLLNAIEHGNLEIGFAQKTALIAAGKLREVIAARCDDVRYRHRTVSVTLCEQGGWRELAIRDAGAGFDWQHYLYRDIDWEHSHGRGLHLARQCGFDVLEFNDKGNQVICRTRLVHSA